MADKISYRDAERKDVALILEFVRELADYEKLSHVMEATADDIAEHLFGPAPKAFSILAEYKGKPAGLALCFYNMSTFLGRPGIYIEDLYVRPEFRGRGIGKGFFRVLAQKAREENCARMEWAVLDWNTSSIEFYKKLSAKALDDWIIYRLDREGIKRLTGKKN